MKFLSRKQREEEFILNRGINKLNIKDIKPLREIVFEHLRNAILDAEKAYADPAHPSNAHKNN